MLFSSDDILQIFLQLEESWRMEVAELVRGLIAKWLTPLERGPQVNTGTQKGEVVEERRGGVASNRNKMSTRAKLSEEI